MVLIRRVKGLRLLAQQFVAYGGEVLPRGGEDLSGIRLTFRVGNPKYWEENPTMDIYSDSWKFGPGGPWGYGVRNRSEGG